LVPIKKGDSPVTRNPAGAKLAREGGVPVNIIVECNAAFASKLRSYEGVVFL
jgi:hypothetical protein